MVGSLAASFPPPNSGEKREGPLLSRRLPNKPVDRRQQQVGFFSNVMKSAESAVMIQPVSNGERSRLSNEMRTPIGSQSALMRAVNWRASE